MTLHNLVVQICISSFLFYCEDMLPLFSIMTLGFYVLSTASTLLVFSIDFCTFNDTQRKCSSILQIFQSNITPPHIAVLDDSVLEKSLFLKNLHPPIIFHFLKMKLLLKIFIRRECTHVIQNTDRCDKIRNFGKIARDQLFHVISKRLSKMYYPRQVSRSS